MNQCPVCSTEIQDSFGLIECPGCKKILFADFDGSLKIHEEGASEAEVETPAAFEHEAPATPAAFSDDWNLDNNTSTNNEAPPLDVLDPVMEPNTEEAQFEEIMTEEELVEAAPKETPSFIEEVNQFANSEASSLKQGALIYNLTIKNIDTEDIKDEILEVLRENKLNIDIKKLKFSLPTLELKDLNPVKVSVIVSKIKHLPVDVEWVQKSAVTGEESEL